MQLLRKTRRASGGGATAEFSVVEVEWQMLGSEDVSDQDSRAAIAVSLSAFLAEPNVWSSREANWTVVLEPADDLGVLPTEVLEVLLNRHEILISFPTFTDGRGYTQAATLRDQLGFAGELIAIGDVRRDQLDFMHQCGFTGFEISGNDSVANMLSSLDELSMPASHRLYSGAAL